MKIEKIEVFVIGPEDTHYTWSEDIPEIYQSNTIIRVYTDSNIIGESAVWNATYFDYDIYTAESLKHLFYNKNFNTIKIEKANQCED